MFMFNEWNMSLYQCKYVSVSFYAILLHQMIEVDNMVT